MTKKGKNQYHSLTLHQYFTERIADFVNMLIQFEKEFFDEYSKRLFQESVVAMVIGLPITPGKSFLLNEQVS